MPAGGPSDSSIQEEEEEGPLFKCFFISYSNHEELQWPFFGELVMESLDLIQHEKVPWTKYIKPSALPGKFPTSLSYIWVEAVPVSDLRHCNGWCVNSMSVVQISWYRWCPADNILQWDWAIWIISMSSTQKKMTSNRNPVDQHFMEYQWGTRTWIFRHILDLQLSISHAATPPTTEVEELASAASMEIPVWGSICCHCNIKWLADDEELISLVCVSIS